jgi:hypothetical protein
MEHPRIAMDLVAHQLLHGYRGGHGQIAASVKLTERDCELVTRLSDLSGSLSSGLQLNPYLTLYPLPSRRFFAVARTYADTDAPRAGCVLTHTLLFPTKLWGTLTEVRAIAQLFRHPRLAPDYDFSLPIDLKLEMNGSCSNDLRVDLFAARTFVSRYFGRGLRPIVWFNADEPDEHLWRILEHLWPKLRCAFSCCTFSLQPRRLEDRPFDLLFAPSSVYSRFAKLPAEHLIEAFAEHNVTQSEFEPWSDYWAQALFSPYPTLPSGETELPVWNDLDEDPTGLRKLSLVHELRLRAAESPTAGVGAIDVVESLAYDPDIAVPLKRQVLADAIKSAANAQAAGEALTSLRLIDDRLGRQSLRNVAPDFEEALTSAAAQVTVRDPQAAIDASGTWLVESASGSKSAFVQGVMSGLRELAKNNPAQLVALRSHPDIAAELFRLEPRFAATYLQIGGVAASRILMAWLRATRETEMLRQVRKSVLPSLEHTDDEELLSALLRDIRAEEVGETLDVLWHQTNGFSGHRVRSVVADRISSSYPQLVRKWASEISKWSNDLSAVVASTYPANRSGFNELLGDNLFRDEVRAEILAIIFRDQVPGSFPYWLRELISHDVRFIKTLLLAGPNAPDAVESGLSRLLTEVPDIPVSSSPELVSLVSQFEGRPVFAQLLDSMMRALIYSFIAEGTDSQNLGAFGNTASAIGWVQKVPTSQLTALLVRASSSGPAATARAWKWICDAPRTLYERRPAVLPDICDSLLISVRKSFPEGIQNSFNQILRRSGRESGKDVRQILSGKMLRFALDNVHLPLGAVVAEAFADVYAVAIKKDRRPSFFSILFGTYDWDKGKDLRVSLVDAFLRSKWPPGDLAIAASNASILPKLFKRLRRSPGGDDYSRAMLQDLNQRNDQHLPNVREHLKSLLANPDFYEEWD